MPHHPDYFPGKQSEWSLLSVGTIVRRVYRIILGVLAAVVVLFSFGWVGYRTFVADPAVPPADVHLRLLQWGDPAETAELRAIAGDFSAEYLQRTGRRVHVEVMQSPKFDMKVYTMSAGGMPPDVFYVTDDNVSVWANLGLLRDLDPLVKQDVAEHGDAWLAEYYPHLLNWFKFDGKHEGQGPQYALPCWHTPFVMFVNTKLFERAGCKVPYDGWTWAEFDETTRKINDLPPDPDQKNPGRTYGAVFSQHQYATRAIIWNTEKDGQAGTLFAGANDDDDSRVTLDNPASQAALERIRVARCVNQTAYNPAGSQVNKDLGLDLFCTGHVGVCGPDGYWSNFSVIKSKPDFKWDIVPIPSDRRERVTTSVAIGWAVGAKTAYPRESFELVKYLTGVAAQKKLATKGMIFPANRIAAEDPAFMDPARAPEHKDIWLTEANRARVPYWPRIKGFLNFYKDDTNNVIMLNRTDTATAARALQADWEAERHSPSNQPGGPLMPWGVILWSAGVVVAGLLVVAGVRLFRRWRSFGQWRHEATGWALIMPWFVGFLVFALGPMLVSLILSFTNWTPSLPITTARWTGCSNFIEMLTGSDRRYLWCLVVTAYYTALIVPLSQIVALGLACLLNSRLPGVNFFRSGFFIPSLIMGTVLASLGTWLFADKECGIINAVLTWLLQPMHLRPPAWFTDDAVIWAVPALVLLGLLGVGYQTTIYLAALKGVPAHLYEAARLDGASPLSQFRHITFPMISPIVQFNIIMAVIGSFQVFTLIQVLTGGGPDNATMAYVVYLYDQGFAQLHMGYASAMAWVLFLIILVVTAAKLGVMRGMVHYEALK